MGTKSSYYQFWLPSVGEPVNLDNAMNANWDLVDRKLASYTRYSPSWTAATTNPELNSGKAQCFYKQMSYFTAFRMYYEMNNDTTYGSGDWVFSAPNIAYWNMNNWYPVATGWAYDSSTGIAYAITGLIYFVSGVTDHNRIKLVNDATGTFVSATVPFTWSFGDAFKLNGYYEGVSNEDGV